MINKNQYPKKKICILSFSDIKNDIRILREIQMASKHYKVTVIGYGAWEPRKNVEFVQLDKNPRDVLYLILYASKLILGRFFPKFYDRSFWGKKEYGIACKMLRERDFDLVHANDWDSLPVAVEAARISDFRLLFDAHEFSPAQEAYHLFGKLFIKPYRDYLLRKYLIEADKVITVSSGLQDLHSKYYNVESDLIMNAASYKQFDRSQTDENKISIIHHGIATKGRYIEEMIKMISLADKRFVLYLMLVETHDRKYVSNLKKIANRIASGRVVFLPPVKPNEVLDAVSAYDIGLPLLKASQRSYFYALPNKFFHYIMAGLAIIVPPLPCMAEIIKKENIGEIAPSTDPRNVANTLNSLDVGTINKFKKNSLKLAKQMNAEIEMEKLHSIYKELMS